MIETHNWASAQKAHADAYNFSLYTFHFTLALLVAWADVWYNVAGITA